MDSMAIPMANLGTNMFTNPKVVQLHVKMHGFYGDNHIGELEYMQNARENIPQSSMYANMQEIPGGVLSGQLPHSHIGDLKCMADTKET